MPKSMNACIRELKEAEEVKDTTWEGPLSQQGGDCPVSAVRNSSCLSHRLTFFLVLASTLLPSRRYQAHCLP
jgi:hypothetical protein